MKQYVVNYQLEDGQKVKATYPMTEDGKKRAEFKSRFFGVPIEIEEAETRKF